MESTQQASRLQYKTIRSLGASQLLPSAATEVLSRGAGFSFALNTSAGNQNDLNDDIALITYRDSNGGITTSFGPKNTSGGQLTLDQIHISANGGGGDTSQIATSIMGSEHVIIGWVNSSTDELLAQKLSFVTGKTGSDPVILPPIPTATTPSSQIPSGLEIPEVVIFSDSSKVARRYIATASTANIKSNILYKLNGFKDLYMVKNICGRAVCGTYSNIAAATAFSTVSNPDSRGNIRSLLGLLSSNQLSAFSVYIFLLINSLAALKIRLSNHI